MAKGNGIQWLMELDAKLDGARAMVKELKESEAAADKADEALRRVEKGFSMGAMVKSLAIWDSIKWGIHKATDAVEWYAKSVLHTIELAAGSERTGKVFENMLGKGEAKETLKYLEEFAKLSEFAEHSLKPVAAELLRAGLRGADLRNALGAAVDVAAEAPDRMGGLSEAVASLSRISLLGKVDARTLRGLRLNPHDVADQLSQDLGLSKETIKKQLETGALDGAKAMQSIFTALERKTGKQLGSAGYEMADTMVARIEKLKEIPEDIAKQFKNTQGYQDISDSLGRFVEAFGADTRFGEMMTKNLDWVGEKLKSVDWDNVSDKLGNIVEQAKQWGEMMKPVVGLLGEAADIIGKIPSVFGFESKNPNAGKGTDAEREELQRQIGIFAGNRMGGAASELKTLEMGADRGKMMAEGLAKGIKEMRGDLGDTGRNAVASVEWGVKDRAEIRSPSRLFARHGELMAEGLADGLRRGGQVVYDAAAGIVPTPDVSALQPSPAGSAGGFNAGGVTINLTLQVQGGAGASPTEIIQQAQAMLPDALLSALEQAAVQAGLS